MVSFRALADNLKRALRRADERFLYKQSAVETFEVTVHDIELVSVNPFRLQPTIRKARAVRVIPDRDDVLYLVDEIKFAVQREGEDVTYFSLQADGVVERLADFLKADVDTALDTLRPLHRATLRLFK